MIATIAVFVEEKKFSDRSDHMETTFQRSKTITEIAGKWFPYDHYNR